MKTLMPDKETDTNKAKILGEFLAGLRAAKGMTLRAVEEATDKEVSNAYLSQLEHGKISKPSPNILYSLSEIYGVSYENLMERAGYLNQDSQKRADSEKHGKAATFALENLTREEEQALIDYLGFYRKTQKKGD